MASWRLAYSLDELRNEIDARWPNRSKASDGTIGDPAHQAEASDHNPNRAGVVCAFDITNDPNGPDSDQLAAQFLAHIHPDLKYIIWNRKIASRTHLWQIRSYTGDPHTNHIHVSVGIGPDGKSVQPYDDRSPAWLISVPTPAPPQEEIVKGTYVQRKGNGEVYLLLSSGNFKHVTDFLNAELVYFTELGVQPAVYSTTVPVQDKRGTTRPVWVLEPPDADMVGIP